MLVKQNKEKKKKKSKSLLISKSSAYKNNYVHCFQEQYTLGKQHDFVNKTVKHLNTYIYLQHNLPEGERKESLRKKQNQTKKPSLSYL